MIFDTLQNCEKYYGVHAGFAQAFAFIKKAVEENYAVGKYEIDGRKIHASVQEYNSKAEADANYEGHRKYIDIQYIASGAEMMQVVDVKKATLKTEYNEEKDVEFYYDTDKAGKVLVEAGEYGIFFPNDIHKPGLSVYGNSAPVKKILVKIALFPTETLGRLKK